MARLTLQTRDMGWEVKEKRGVRRLRCSQATHSTWAPKDEDCSEQPGSPGCAVGPSGITWRLVRNAQSERSTQKLWGWG